METIEMKEVNGKWIEDRTKVEKKEVKIIKPNLRDPFFDPQQFLKSLEDMEESRENITIII